eukprot:TRINITY_DN7080_c0_g1_i1.p1 TRINITY_DN7080_c0_g1~~TRINITY_DN7080_c0_g1_i1.p1  ORF type:complete len:227 (+),score=24.67 TRINITY_DN7080_c0_g1_i1:50-730(+)
MFTRVTVFCLLLVFLVRTEGQTCNSYTNCDNTTCAHWYDYNNDCIASLDRDGPSFDGFKQSLATAVNIMRQYPGVLSDDSLLPHITVQYLCCLSFSQYVEVIGVIGSLKWSPFNVTFDKVICNKGGNGIDSAWSIVVLASQETQTVMANFVDSIEAAIIKAGIPVNTPRSRQEPFHSTIGVVSEGYPVDEVIKQMNQKIKQWNPIPMQIDSFAMIFPPYDFKATTQ